MNAVVHVDPFHRLLESEAKGFFFLKLALADHTNEQKLMAIVNRAHSVYDRAVADQSLSNFLPVMRFRRVCDDIELVIMREASRDSEELEVGKVVLTQVHDPVNECAILALPTCLQAPHQQLKRLTLDDLKRRLELYYEVVDVCAANTLARMVKSFEEISASCPNSKWEYDLSSSSERLGLRVRKNGKSAMVLFVDIHL